MSLHEQVKQAATLLPHVGFLQVVAADASALDNPATRLAAEAVLRSYASKLPQPARIPAEKKTRSAQSLASPDPAINGWRTERRMPEPPRVGKIDRTGLSHQKRLIDSVAWIVENYEASGLTPRQAAEEIFVEIQSGRWIG